MTIRKSFSMRMVAVALASLSLPSLTLAQASDGRNPAQPPWHESHNPGAKGTQISIPKLLLEDIKADQRDCPEGSPDESLQLEAYKITRKGFVLIAVWGRSSCYCSPTGNCDFWIYRLRHGGYDQVLATSMVRDFGFVKSRTNGLPDLVRWSHDSADRSPGGLWKFDGANYVPQCGWEIVSTYKECPDHIWRVAKQLIESNTCKGFDKNGRTLRRKD